MAHFTAPQHPNNFVGPHDDGTEAARDYYPMFLEGGMLDAAAASAARDSLSDFYTTYANGEAVKVLRHDYDNQADYLAWYESEYRRGYLERVVRMLRQQIDDARLGAAALHTSQPQVEQATVESAPVAVGEKRNFAGKHSPQPYILTCVFAGSQADVDDETDEVLSVNPTAYWAFLG